MNHTLLIITAGCIGVSNLANFIRGLEGRNAFIDTRDYSSNLIEYLMVYIIGGLGLAGFYLGVLIRSISKWIKYKKEYKKYK